MSPPCLPDSSNASTIAPQSQTVRCKRRALICSSCAPDGSLPVRVLVVVRLGVVRLLVVRVRRVLARLSRVTTVRVAHHARVRVLLLVRA